MPERAFCESGPGGDRELRACAAPVAREGRDHRMFQPDGLTCSHRETGAKMTPATT